MEVAEAERRRHPVAARTEPDAVAFAAVVRLWVLSAEGASARWKEGVDGQARRDVKAGGGEAAASSAGMTEMSK